MSEPTLKDVLDAIARVEKGQSDLRSELTSVRSELFQLRSEVKAGFDALDAELTKHAGTHREIEKDIENIKRRPARTAARPTRRR